MEININTRHGFGSSRELDLSSLPVEHVDKAQRGIGCFLVVFALLWGGLPTVGLIVALITGNVEPGMFFILIFSLVGAGLLLLGLKLLSTRRVSHFEPDRISFDERSMFGHKAWTEPLERFDGVRSRSEYHSGGKNSSSYTVYIIELYHTDKKKRIRLYESRAESGLRQRLETYCRQLNLPAIEGDEGNFTVRAVEDLDKSVRELAQEGKLEVNFDPTRPPPDGVRLNVDGDKLRIELSPARMPVAGAAVGLLVPAIFIGIGFGIPDVPLFFGIIGIVVLLVFALAIGWGRLAIPIVIVSPQALHVLHRLPWGETKGHVIAADHIESVRIGRAVENQGRPGVLVVTDLRTETLAQGQPTDAQNWLLNCILAVITR